MERGSLRRLPIWVLAGVTLDTVTLAGIWLLLYAVGPLNEDLEWLLDAIGLATVPWLVHVIALTAIFRIDWIDADHLLGRTSVFIGLAAMLIPVLGVGVFMFAGLSSFWIALLFTDGRMPLAAAVPPTGTDQAIYCGFRTIIATFVGAGIGYLLHVLRPDAKADQVVLCLPPCPRMRSDMLGGMCAACLAFGGMFLALPFGLFSRAGGRAANGGHEFSTVPGLAATVIIGVVALLPHLLMVGRDLFGPSCRSEARNASFVGTIDGTTE